MPVTTPVTNPTKPAIAAVVAGLVVAVSLAGGGYSGGIRSAVAVLAWGVISGGLAFGLFPRSRTPAVALVAGGMLAADVLLAVASVAWAGDAEGAIAAAVLAMAYLGIFALVICIAREGDARSWLLGLALGIAAVGALALLSRLVRGLPGGDAEIARLLPSARGRLSYPINYWNATAALLALGTVLMTWLGASGRSLLGRGLSVAAIPMLTLGIYLASSRGGFAELLIGLIVLIALGPRRPQLLGSAVIGGLGAGLAIALASGQTALLDATSGADANNQGFELLGATAACVFFTGVLRVVVDGYLERVKVSPLAARLAVVACVAAALVGAAISDPSARFDEFKSVPTNEGAGRTDFIASHLSSGSGSGRWQFWGVALDAYGDQPVRGIGAGGYANYWNKHAPISRVTKQAHSLYLEQLAELGPLGLQLILGLLTVPVVAGLRARSALPGGEVGTAIALVATGALAAAIDWVWQTPAVFGVVVVALALLAGPSIRAQGAAARTRDPSALGPRLLRVAIVLFGLVAVLVAGDQLLAKRSLDASQSAARENDLGRAADEARNAIALEPWAAEPRLQLGLIQESAGDLPAAAHSTQEAIDRSPDDWSLWLVRARILTRQGLLVQAGEALRKARSLNPRAPLFTALSGPLSG
jgi:tetratricopeptide (TPR) repeat protein